MKKLFLKNSVLIFISGLIFFSFLQLIFAFRTNAYFSVDDFAVLSYFKNHSVIQMIPDFLIHGDIFNFRRIVGYAFFGGIFKSFGVNALAFDVFMFISNAINLIFLFLIVKKLTKNNFAAFFVSVVFNKNYLYYYSNIHEHLLALFCFLTIYLFLTYPKKFYLSVITFILALFTKETAVTVPVVLLAISFFYKTDKRKIYYLLGIALLYGLYATYFFVTQKVLIPNFSYAVAPQISDIYKGILYFIDFKILILFLILPIFPKKYIYLPILLAALITLIPASLLVNRREMYYIYMPFGYLMVYLAMFLPRISFKSSLVYILIFFILGGRSILPKIAWHSFPNWEKVSMENVTTKVDSSLAGGPKTATISLNDVNLERDANLMLQSGDLDLFVNKNISANYQFEYNRGLNTITATRK